MHQSFKHNDCPDTNDFDPEVENVSIPGDTDEMEVADSDS